MAQEIDPTRVVEVGNIQLDCKKWPSLIRPGFFKDKVVTKFRIKKHNLKIKEELQK